MPSVTFSYVPRVPREGAGGAVSLRFTLSRRCAHMRRMDSVSDAQMDLAGFPADRVRKPSVLRDLAEVFEQHGPVVPQHMVAKLLGVSKQRVGQFVDAGRLAVVKLGGHQYVPYEALRYFLADERKNGRPFKLAEFAVESPLVKLAEKNS